VTSEKPTGVLGSVRRLEGALDATATTRVASERRLEEARSAAARLLAAARQDAAAAAAERRRVMLATADEEAAEISRRGAETAARVRADARVSCSKVIEAALALILPGDGKSEA
jgi:vacuolar-type H+-ATPase subunit H